MASRAKTLPARVDELTAAGMPEHDALALAGVEYAEGRLADEKAPRPVMSNAQMLWNAAATFALSWLALSLLGLVH